MIVERPSVKVGGHEVALNEDIKEIERILGRLCERIARLECFAAEMTGRAERLREND